jgi:erythromycin esterase
VDGWQAERTWKMLSGGSVIGLGEATHGQSESCDVKLRLTKLAVKEGGCRVVAYEASAARAMACDDYISGRTNDLAAAVGGLGMLIWQIEENRSLLQELRAWNDRARPSDRVRFIGVDVQDPTAAMAVLRAILPASHAGLVDEAAAMAAKSGPAAQACFAGDLAPMEALKAELKSWGARLEAVEGLSSSAASRRTLCRMEIEAGLTMVSSPGARDHAMAQMVLAQMEGVDASRPMVIWAHNAHVMHAPLRYMGEAGLSEQAMGGHLREALGERYVSVGFAFGRGSFNALDREGDVWRFRTYTVGEPRPDSLEAMLDTAGTGNCAIDLRRNVEGSLVDPRVRQWLESGHGQRWFGGYNVHIDESLPLLATYPRLDYDVLIYLHYSSPSKPLNSRR